MHSGVVVRASKKLYFTQQKLRCDKDALLVTYHYYDYVDELTCYKNEDGTPKTSRKLKLLKHAPIPIGEFIKIYHDACTTATTSGT